MVLLHLVRLNLESIVPPVYVPCNGFFTNFERVLKSKYITNRGRFRRFSRRSYLAYLDWCLSASYGLWLEVLK